MNTDFVDPIDGGRELREGLFDVVTFAKQTDVGPTVVFFSHTEATDGPQVTNMTKKNELPAGEEMLVYSLRFGIRGAASADVAAIRKAFRLRLVVAGKQVLSGPTEKFPFGGSMTSEATEVSAQTFWIPSDDLAIRIPATIQFRVELHGNAKYTLTDANKGVDFVCELDGIHTVPKN